jgi:DNA-binding NarL/FixJ family response regulator
MALTLTAGVSIIAWLSEAREQSMSNRYLVVEDHPLFAEALLLILRANVAGTHVTHVRTIADAKLAICAGEPFDMILLDLRLPDSHGFDGLVDLRNRFPRLPIVVVSAFTGPSVQDKAIVFGAAAFIAKSASRDAFRRVLDYVCRGEASGTAERIMTHDAGVLLPATSRQRPLTGQQIRVLQAICNGLQNKRIAIDLDIAETTVKAHVSEILRKLHVTSRTQAVLEVSKLEAAITVPASKSRESIHTPFAEFV